LVWGVRGLNHCRFQSGCKGLLDFLKNRLEKIAGGINKSEFEEISKISNEMIKVHCCCCSGEWRVSLFKFSAVTNPDRHHLFTCSYHSTRHPTANHHCNGYIMLEYVKREQNKIISPSFEKGLRAVNSHVFNRT